MTSADVTNAPCEGCPDVPYPPAPMVPVGEEPSVEDILSRLPKGTSGGPLPEKPGLTYTDFWSIHLGGTPEDHLVGIIRLLPKGYGKMRAHPDGSLEYAKKGPDDFEPPSPINGYERDQKNQWLFRPLWESCAFRHYGVVVKEKCQCIDVITKCSISLHWVRYADCLKCGARLPIKILQVPKRKTRSTLLHPNLDRNSK